MIRWIGALTLLSAMLSAPSFANLSRQISPSISDSHGFQIAGDQEPGSKNPQTPLPSEDKPATPDELGPPGSQARDCAAACDTRCSSLGSPELTVQCRRICAGRCLAPVEK